jgi:hypothetical protein
MSRDKRGIVNPVVGGSSPPATAKGTTSARSISAIGETYRDSSSCTARRPDRCGFTLVAVHTIRVLSTVEPCIQRRTMLPGREAAAVSAGRNVSASVAAEHVELGCHRRPYRPRAALAPANR